MNIITRLRKTAEQKRSNNQIKDPHTVHDVMALPGVNDVMASER